MTGTYRFKIVILRDTDTIEAAEATVVGIVFGKNYADAMQNLESFYGDTLVSVEKLKIITDSSILELPEKESNILDDIEENWIW